MIKPSISTGAQIIAFVVFERIASILKDDLLQILTNQLRRMLPIYMLPAEYIVLDELPLTVNGKLDKSALLSFEGRRLGSEAAGSGPRSATEEILSGIWRELLGVTKVSVNDNFFMLGGNSLLAMRLAAMLNEQLAIDTSIKTIFESPTLESMAFYLDFLIKNKKSKEDDLNKEEMEDFQV